MHVRRLLLGAERQLLVQGPNFQTTICVSKFCPSVASPIRRLLSARQHLFLQIWFLTLRET